MQEPAMALYTVLRDSWSLVDPLLDTIGGDDKDILLTTGWYEEDFQGPQITISEVSDRNEPFELGYKTIRVTATHQIDIWVPIIRESEKGPGLAKKHKWMIREEVKRILKANLTGLQDLRYVVLDQTGRNLDDLEHSPPILRYSLDISVIYDIV